MKKITKHSKYYSKAPYLPYVAPFRRLKPEIFLKEKMNFHQMEHVVGTTQINVVLDLQSVQRRKPTL